MYRVLIIFIFGVFLTACGGGGGGGGTPTFALTDPPTPIDPTSPTTSELTTITEKLVTTPDPKTGKSIEVPEDRLLIINGKVTILPDGETRPPFYPDITSSATLYATFVPSLNPLLGVKALPVSDNIPFASSNSASNSDSAITLSRVGTRVTYAGVEYNFQDNPLPYVGGQFSDIVTPDDNKLFIQSYVSAHTGLAVIQRTEDSVASSYARGDKNVLVESLLVSQGGALTPTFSLPKSEVNYHGIVTGILQPDINVALSNSDNVINVFKMTVDFERSENSISGTVKNLTEEITGTFTGSRTGSEFDLDYNISSASSSNVNINGGFYGSAAEEVSGIGSGTYGENGRATLGLLGTIEESSD